MIRFFRKKGKPLVIITVLFFIGSIILSVLVSLVSIFL